MFIFFTEAIRKGVVDKNGRWLGLPHDLLVSNIAEPYPKLSAIVLSRGTIKKSFARVAWKDIKCTAKQYQLKIPCESLEWNSDYLSEDFQTSIKIHILDQQVVDTFNRKVVRVNDVHMLSVDNDLRIAHVDIGLRGMVRRMGWQSAVDGIVSFVNPHAGYLIREGFLAWKFVQPLSVHPDKGTIQLSVDQDQLRSIPPPDLSEMLKEMDVYQRGALFKTLDVETQVGIITEMDIKMQKELLGELNSRTCGALFEAMPSDEAADLLSELPRRLADRILTSINSKKAKKLSTLLSHKSKSAGGLMTTEFITLNNRMTVGDAIDHIKKLQDVAETIYYAYVVDPDGRLEGAVTFKHLLIEPLEVNVAEIMQTKPACVHLDDSAKEVAYVFDKYNLMAVPVIDHNRVLQGIITIDDILSLVIEETWGKKTGLL